MNSLTVQIAAIQGKLASSDFTRETILQYRNKYNHIPAPNGHRGHQFERATISDTTRRIKKKTPQILVRREILTPSLMELMVQET
jgi:hypothetical protein